MEFLALSDIVLDNSVKLVEQYIQENGLSDNDGFVEYVASRAFDELSNWSQYRRLTSAQILRLMGRYISIVSGSYRHLQLKSNPTCNAFSGHDKIKQVIQDQISLNPNIVDYTSNVFEQYASFLHHSGRTSFANVIAQTCKDKYINDLETLNKLYLDTIQRFETDYDISSMLCFDNIEQGLNMLVNHKEKMQAIFSCVDSNGLLFDIAVTSYISSVTLKYRSHFNMVYTSIDGKENHQVVNRYEISNHLLLLGAQLKQVMPNPDLNKNS